MTSNSRKQIAYAIAYTAFATIVATRFLGCSAKTPSASEQANVAAYGSALGNCVVQSNTRAEYDACVCKVDTDFKMAAPRCSK